MAKKKTKAAPKPPPGIERLSVLNLKGSPEYHEWLVLISGKSLIPASTIVRDALAKWAKEKGYQAPPEI